MNSFKDHFSKQSDLYLKYRPKYPLELYAFLASLTYDHDLCWDCGTGNGQAAIDLARVYKKIIATDPSEQQIKNALPHAQVEYRLQKAEQTDLETNSCDLITVANALHWFNLSDFYKEVNRVSKPGGVIAAWSYCIPTINEQIDAVIHEYHYETLDHLWLPENRLVEKEYTTIPFPFEEIKSPPLFYEKEFDLSEMIGYLNTWSATQRYIETYKHNPTEDVWNTLLKVWGNQKEKKKVTWKIALKIGKVSKDH